ncbi:UNVERIFIED_ORG: hypothetical protein GGD59_004453 [Rhizobium esperanzae]
MTTDINGTALAVFIFFFALVTVMGFVASRWRKPETLAHIDEWGLGGRNFGTWITWFLVGGDFYTAYTVIAVPALVYTVGAYGFFALPYTIVVYPFVFMVMPVLWKRAKDFGYVTAADVVHGQYGSRGLELAVAATGVIATMPYIALQLVGMTAVLKALGLHGELPLAIAFIVLALYTYSAGLRAPALIAFVKDIMIYIVGDCSGRAHPVEARRLCQCLCLGRCGLPGQGRRQPAARRQPVCRLCHARSRFGARGLHVSAYADRHLCLQQRQDDPQERDHAARLYAAARPAGAARLYGPCGQSEARQRQ